MLEAYFVRIRHKEFLAEAERNRLLAMAEKKHVTSIPIVARLLGNVGGLLCRWGSLLEDRFAIDSDPRLTHPVDRGMEL